MQEVPDSKIHSSPGPRHTLAPSKDAEDAYIGRRRAVTILPNYRLFVDASQRCPPKQGLAIHRSCSKVLLRQQQQQQQQQQRNQQPKPPCHTTFLLQASETPTQAMLGKNALLQQRAEPLVFF